MLRQPIAGAFVRTVYFDHARVSLLDHGATERERSGPTATTALDGTFALPLDRGDHVELRASVFRIRTSTSNSRVAPDAIDDSRLTIVLE